jgi:iron complex outermembrane receptor protein
VAHWKYYGNFGKLLLRSGYADKKLDYKQMNRIPGLGLIPSIWSESRQKSLYNTLSYSGETEWDLGWEGKLDMNVHQVHSSDTVSVEGYEGRRRELSAMFAISKSIVDRLNLNLILRQEWVDGDRLPLIPYLGMDFRLIRGMDLVLKGNVARNYHLPTLNDLYWKPGGNPDLLPEEGWTIEGGMAYQKELMGHLLHTELSVYRSKIDNWILWIPSYRGYWEPRNVRSVLSKGLEYHLKLQGFISAFNYKVSAGYSYTSAINLGDPMTWSDESHGKQLVYIPLHSGNLLLHLGWNKLFVNYQYNAYSERFTTSSNDVTRRDRLYPYFMNDVAAGSNFHLKHLDLCVELKVYNLFNESYHTVLYRPMPGRNYQVVVKIKI